MFLVKHGLIIVERDTGFRCGAYRRTNARHVISRSAVVIAAAQKAAKLGNQYMGLGKAVAIKDLPGYYFEMVIIFGLSLIHYAPELWRLK